MAEEAFGHKLNTHQHIALLPELRQRLLSPVNTPVKGTVGPAQATQATRRVRLDLAVEFECPFKIILNKRLVCIVCQCFGHVLCWSGPSSEGFGQAKTKTISSKSLKNSIRSRLNETAEKGSCEQTIEDGKEACGEQGDCRHSCLWEGKPDFSAFPANSRAGDHSVSGT